MAYLEPDWKGTKKKMKKRKEGPWFANGGFRFVMTTVTFHGSF
jgi:hypothetical protein